MTRALLTVLLLLAWGAAGYWAGDYNRNNAWLAKQAVAERQAHEAFAAEVKRGQDAAGYFITEYQAMQTNFSTLEGQFNELRTRGSLVVYRSNRPAGPVAHAADATDASGTQTAAQPGGAPPAQADAPADVAADGLRLNFGAVWMWNSALTGTDTPAGACGAADTAAPACALDAGITLDAAWANHIANAKTCAEDRFKYQRLIDFVTTGPHP